MRCSSCEPLLDAFLEGTLDRRQAHAVAHHLRRCAHCESFLHELRVVDALLTTASTPGHVGSEFTKSVVSQTRHAAPHPVKRVPLWVLLLGYLAIAWALLGLGELRGYSFGTLLNNLAGAAARSFIAVDAAVRAVSPATSLLAAAVTGVLVLDIFLFVAIFYGYRRLRPLLADYLARSPRS
ncbi:MAG TPA: zf-HC2 domain-containing protein [Candidatus Cybelea sp.]|jgi:anti-sigma factor RsiW